MNSKSKGGPGWMALKLDVSKAYDKVEWSFLEQVMVKLGFPPPFIRLVMLCVSSVSFSFMLGGKQFGSVIPRRGLRQGDPLSPYLFLLCTESFSSLLQLAEQEGRLKGVSVCRGAPSISHLLFADDTLIFCRASPENTRAVLDVLEVYRRASGQEINFSKSSVAFSKNTGEEICARIVTALSVRRENKMELYLGLPSKVARTKKALFSTIRDNIWKRMSGWNAKLLSQAGREVLIKSVLQAIPTYAMSCFRLSITLLPKQWWRLWQSPDKLLSRVLRARYFPSGNLFEASLGSRPSFTWRSVMAALFLFRAGCRWRIGSGVHVRVWTDPWLPRPRSFRPITPPAPNLAHLLVSELIDPVRDWKTELVERLFWPCDSSIILAIPLSRVGEGDLLTWHYSKNGSFTVRSAYHLAVSLTDTPCSSSRAAAETAWWRKVWPARVPNKVKVFIWRACLNALPTGVNLRKRASICQVMCPLCGDGSEDVLHVLLRCPFASQVWGLISLAADFKVGGKQGELLWMQSVASQLDAQSFGLFMCVCWALWWFRNRSAMEGERVTPVHVATFAPQFLNSFLHQAAASSSPPNSSTPSSWKAPPLEHVKINFDGAVVGEKSEMGIGVIARDSQGQCVAWMTHRIRRAGFGELAESWAAREAIQFALRRGWRRVVLEGDCLNLIRKLNAGQGDLSFTGPLVLDIQYFAAKFSSCQFSWIKRSGNSVVHFLAQTANGYVEGGSIVPPSVLGLLSSDISN
ncbi:UNVERIFIED_CONTAM: putative mitochondrial protein [Sesamum radiatum]|uniref:Mitochondrial protein n=1 Tax=Sesamum radiatum TaxID=300843 RepID=A0AAW2T5T6_SESRA